MRQSVHCAGVVAVDAATVDSATESVASTNDCVDAILEDLVGAVTWMPTCHSAVARAELCCAGRPGD